MQRREIDAGGEDRGTVAGAGAGIGGRNCKWSLGKQLAFFNSSLFDLSSLDLSRLTRGGKVGGEQSSDRSKIGS